MTQRELRIEARSPVLFLIFNRFEATRRSFEAIRSVKPPKLYVAADGPRSNVPGDEEACKAVQSYVLSNIDWNCDVRTLIRPANIGCTKAVTSAIDWFFENEKSGIILEDDCVASDGFFTFCDQMLLEFSEDETVCGVTGWCFANLDDGSVSEYGLTHFPNVWGWATWRRVWSLYDLEISNWSGCVSSLGRVSQIDEACASLFGSAFDLIKRGTLDTWVYQLFHLTFARSGRFVFPVGSLVENIGFQSGATHNNPKKKLTNSIKRNNIYMPLLEVDGAYYDEWLAKNVYAI